MSLDNLELFVQVAERGSFSGAAKALGLPKSTVSRRIQRLEEALGLTLIQRAGRSWSLTQDGQQLASRSQGPLRELADVRDAVREAGDLPQGTLRLAVSIEFGGSAAFIGLLADYHSKYPKVDIDLRVDERLVDFVEDGVDIALRAHGGQLAPRSGIIARHLATLSAGLVASPRYLDQRGRPASPLELEGHDLIAPSLANFGPVWPFADGGLGTTLGFELQPSFRSNEFRSLLAAAAAGFGIGACPLFLAQEVLDAGHVERVLPDVAVRTGSISAVWPRSRNLSPRVRTLVDFLVERFDAGLAAGRRQT